ncbi:MAG: aspartyl/asparaginyl beta-hydroxylase domain-containing protein [Bryobacteraceae bacterium]
MFYQSGEFEFTSRLEENWQAIRKELEALPESNFIPWKETVLYDTGWDVFGLYAFGKKIEENCRVCPQATRVLETIPGLVTGGFSSLKPQTHILPHVGYSYKYSPDGTMERTELNNDVLRCHLGLIIPPTFTPIGCAIRVGEELRNWEEGKCLVFDDTIEHEAWNRSQGTRVVMIVDFLKEGAQRT